MGLVGNSIIVNISYIIKATFTNKKVLVFEFDTALLSVYLVSSTLYVHYLTTSEKINVSKTGPMDDSVILNTN